MNPGPWGVLIIAIVVLLLFGRGKIGNLMGEVAGGIKAFRKGMAEDERTAELEHDRVQTPPPAQPAPTASPTYAPAPGSDRRDV